MGFTLLHFVRQTPIDSLRDYFAARGLAWPEAMAGSPHAEQRALIAAIDGLDDDRRERTYIEFEEVEKLSDEVGLRALRGLIAFDPECLGTFDALKAHEARALFVLAVDPDAFHHALAVAEAEREARDCRSTRNHTRFARTDPSGHCGTPMSAMQPDNSQWAAPV